MAQSKKMKAVALKYPEGVEAPIILAKAQGRTAELMLNEAKKNNVTNKRILNQMIIK